MFVALAVAVAAAEKPAADPREHWAFNPPTRATVPVITNSSWVIRNSIDAFLAAQWQKRSLAPVPPASKEILLRRVYLDLIGLPPTREERQAFLADTSSDAYEKVVERLLESPQYGERWARHWMDIWRYADWYGRRHVPDVWNSAPQVWRWRDWIVRSLNADKGYDRMVVEMLAADEVAPEDDPTRTATGYLVRNWYALNPGQWMRDLVKHTGKAFLGLTLNCAHCHDHKYDPITQRDYFQFRAFFEPLQVRQDWVKGEPDPGPFQKYEYSTPRKVVTNGLVSVFDENLDAKTFIYLRGDERSFPDGKPTVEPTGPAFLRGDTLKPQRIDLPASAAYPGLKPFIREAETKQRQRALAAAKEAWAGATKACDAARAKLVSAESANNLAARAKAFGELLAAEVSARNKSNQIAVAQAELNALGLRLAADEAQFASGHGPTSTATNEMTAASRAERLIALRKAEARSAEAEGTLALLLAEQTIAAARRSAGAAGEKKDDKAEAALKQVQEQFTAAQKAVAGAQAALDTNSTAYTPLTPRYPTQSTGRRKALANWIVSPGNPLTARVAVNHIWTRHFHTPLVASLFDFGRNGARPTHPELLDWLAIEFVEQGWSMKHLHRLMVTSSAYRMASSDAPVRNADTSVRQLIPASAKVMESRSNDVRGTLQETATATLQHSSTSLSIDPENRFLWRMNAWQMEAEVLRDSLLHLAAELDLSPVGYPLPNAAAETNCHRSLYFECFPEPSGASQFAELFDPPSPTECYRRTQSIVPQQALALANSKLSNERSRALARQLIQKLDPNQRDDQTSVIIAAYEQILSRTPTSNELAACSEFLARQLSLAAPEPARASLIHALFNHNDFITVR